MVLIVHVVQLHVLTFSVQCCGVRYYVRFVCTPICFVRRSYYIGVIYVSQIHKYMSFFLMVILMMFVSVNSNTTGTNSRAGTASLLEHLSFEFTPAVVFCRSLKFIVLFLLVIHDPSFYGL